MDDKNSLNSFSGNEHKSKEEIIKDLCSSPIINRKANEYIGIKKDNLFQISPDNIYNDFVQ